MTRTLKNGTGTKAGSARPWSTQPKPTQPKPTQPKAIRAKAPTRTRIDPEAPDEKLWELRLYVAGTTPRSRTALANLRAICEDHLAGRYTIEVIDLLEHPLLSRGDQILAIPTLVRRLPEPMRKIIGDLSDTQRVLIGLDLRPADEEG